ncbi:MAG: polyprenyl diphosphate synthase [Patescibacteria group bacterium]
MNLTIPKHVAIIMDGNRRWAKGRGLPVLAGHKKVADDILIPLVEHAADRGISYMTFWAFSTENWQRDTEEVSGIMEIFRHVIKKRWQRLHEKGVRIRVIGDLSKFSDDIKKSLVAVEEQTKNNTKITAVFALNYGGRDEIKRAVEKGGENFEKYLDTQGIPDPDIIVRTGGEQRLSGFLPWQGVYSELYFPAWYMPEFTPEKLDEVVEEYAARQRRFGK